MAHETKKIFTKQELLKLLHFLFYHLDIDTASLRRSLGRLGVELVLNLSMQFRVKFCPKKKGCPAIVASAKQSKNVTHHLCLEF